MFWTNKPYFCNRFMVLCSNKARYYIPSKEFQLFLDNDEDVKYIETYISKIQYNTSLIDFFKHCFWKLTGFEVR